MLLLNFSVSESGELTKTLPFLMIESVAMVLIVNVNTDKVIFY